VRLEANGVVGDTDLICKLDNPRNRSRKLAVALVDPSDSQSASSRHRRCDSGLKRGHADWAAVSWRFVPRFRGLVFLWFGLDFGRFRLRAQHVRAGAATLIRQGLGSSKGDGRSMLRQRSQAGNREDPELQGNGAFFVEGESDER